jgi:hypothetical protein
VGSKYWDNLSSAFIVFNVAVMMCEHEGQTDPWLETQELLNHVCLVFFTVEMFCKLVAYFPLKYLADPWSKFDGSVITLSWAAIVFDLGSVQAIRALRALRIVLVLKSARGLRSLFQTLILSIYPAINISVLLLLLYAIYAILGMQLFGNMPLQDIECARSGAHGLGEHQEREGEGLDLGSFPGYCTIGTRAGDPDTRCENTTSRDL